MKEPSILDMTKQTILDFVRNKEGILSASFSRTFSFLNVETKYYSTSISISGITDDNSYLKYASKRHVLDINDPEFFDALTRKLNFMITNQPEKIE